MKKLIIAIVIGLSLVFVGGIAMLIGGSIVYKNHGDFNLSRYENKTYIAEEEVNDLSIDLTTFDLNIKISSDDKLKVEYFSSDKEKCDIVLENGLLKITDIDERKWFEKIFTFGNKVLTIYLPEKEYNSLNVELTTGDVKFNNDITFLNTNVKIVTGDIKGSLNVLNDFTIKTTTGDVELNDINCKNFSIVGTTGDVELANVIASDNLTLKTTTGDIEFSNCDSKNVIITTTTGDVSGTLLTGKIFDVSITTGEKIIPQNSEGGNCKITVTTGDVKIKII